MTALVDRLLKSSAANVLSLVARVSEQLLLVPILLSAWSVERYGEWILLSALPTFLAMSDMGFITAGSNELARRASREDNGSVRRFYGWYAALCNVWGVALGGGLCLLAWLLPLNELFGLTVIPASEASIAFLFLAVGSLFSQNSLVLLAGLRVSGRYHQGLLVRAFFSFARLFLIAIAVLYAEAGPVGVAAISCGGFLAAYLMERALVVRLKLRPVWVSLFRESEPIRPYLLMGLEYMLMPLAQMLVLQGMVIFVGTVLGAVAVAVFTTHRTLTRMVSSLLQIVSNPLTAEVGLLQRPEDLPELQRVLLLVSRITLWTSLLVVTGFFATGEWIFYSWTRNEVAYDSVLFSILLLATLSETIWRTLSSVRMGTNRHRPLVWGYLFLTLSGLLMASVLVASFGLAGVAFATMLVDAGMCALTILVTLPLINLSARAYLAGLLRPPLAEISFLLNSISRRRRSK